MKSDSGVFAVSRRIGRIGWRNGGKRTAWPGKSAGGGATLRIPLSGLRPLPEGAAYTEREGRAALSARIVRDTLYVDATCDSLQQVIWDYERLLSERQSAVASVDKESERETLARWPFFLLLALSLLLFARKRPG